MKSIITLLLLTPILLFVPYVHAQEEEEDNQEQNVVDEVAEEGQDAIERIKDAVASKVAELDLVEKKGVFGSVAQVSTTEITLKNEAGNQSIIEIDELTRFEGERQSEDFGISDIEEGDIISVVGLYNKDTERLLSRFITQRVNIPTHISGAIQEVDEDNFTITVVDNTGQEYIIDIEVSTDTNVYEEEEMLSSGFSQLEVGEKVIVSALPDANEQNRYAAERILHFTDIPPSEETQQRLEELSETEEDAPTPSPEEE